MSPAFHDFYSFLVGGSVEIRFYVGLNKPLAYRITLGPCKSLRRDRLTRVVLNSAT